MRALDVAGLFYPSEEDAALVVEELGPGSVVEAVHARWPDAEEASVDDFFAAPSRGGFAAAYPENVAGFAALRTALEAAAGPLAAFVMGEGIETHLVAGRDRDSGHVVAVVATVVAT